MTNELGKGNSHSLDDVPFVLVGGGLNFRMGPPLKYSGLARGIGHRLQKFGNPDYCGDGPLPNLT